MKLLDDHTPTEFPLDANSPAWLEKEIGREHDLLGSRIAWCLSTQAFLMTPFILSATKPDTARADLATVFAIIGLISTGLFMLSIRAALVAIKKLLERQQSVCESANAGDEYKRFHLFWRESDWRARIHGWNLSTCKWIPVLLIVAWFALLIMVWVPHP